MTPQEIAAAAARIAPLIHRTPVMTSSILDGIANARCFVKCENLQRGGSFKLRGATNFVYSIPEPDRPKGVVAFSSGNHGQAVAIAAKSLGMHATIVMPADAPKAKVEATRGRGAEIVTYNRLTEDRIAIGKRIAAETGATLVPPYDHLWTIAGQGTVALELLEQEPDLDALLVCLGGGGLLSGCATWAKHARPGIRVFGVEPELANDWWLSFQKGEPVEIPPPATIADGLRTQVPGKITWPIVRSLVDGVILVTEDEIRAAMRFALTRMKIVAEPSGAVTLAAALHGKLPAGARRVGLILSGGNVDLELLAELG
ncbi:MAG: threonine/serine dehydratase [Bryobacter sp.]|nr:threonine/serine dehydratase [Bryobacter sp.]